MTTTLQLRALATLAVFCLLAPSSWAGLLLDYYDVPIAADSIRMSQSPSGAGKFSFSTSDPTLVIPAVESISDPSYYGLEIDLFGRDGSVRATLVVPGEVGWKVKAGDPPTYTYSNPKAPAGGMVVKKLTLRPGKGLKLNAKTSGLPMDAANGPVGVRIRFVEASRYCAFFQAATIADDRPGKYRAEGASASALVDCYDNTMAGALPLCGDSLISSDEQCDGNGTCQIDGAQGAGCVIPGAPSECSCCSNAGGFGLGCCQPSNVVAVSPGSRICTPNSCSPPFECASGDVCQDDESCCRLEGGGCLLAPVNQVFLGCCPGLICDRRGFQAGPFTQIDCCRPGAAACASDNECCSSLCEPSGFCATAAPNGAACGLVTPCASGNCGANGKCAP